MSTGHQLDLVGTCETIGAGQATHSLLPDDILRIGRVVEALYVELERATNGLASASRWNISDITRAAMTTQIIGCRAALDEATAWRCGVPLPPPPPPLGHRLMLTKHAEGDDLPEWLREDPEDPRLSDAKARADGDATIAWLVAQIEQLSNERSDGYAIAHGVVADFDGIVGDHVRDELKELLTRPVEGVSLPPLGNEQAAQYSQAVQVVYATGNPSVSLVQRELKTGYRLAVELVDRMEQEGFVSEPGVDGRRIVFDKPAARAVYREAEDARNAHLRSAVRDEPGS